MKISSAWRAARLAVSVSRSAQSFRTGCTGFTGLVSFPFACGHPVNQGQLVNLRPSLQPQQFIHPDELVALARQVVEQFPKPRVELVRPSRPGTKVQQQDKPIQAVGVLSLPGDNA